MSRVGALVLLITALPLARVTARGLAVLAAAALLSVALITVWVRAARLPRRLAVLDVAGLAAVLVCTGTPVVGSALTGARPGESPAYDFVVTATIAVSMPAWPLPAALSGTAVLAAANLSTALVPRSNYPLWNALPDSVTFLGVCLVVWLIAWLVRRSAATLDARHRDAVTRAAALARERERARQSQALGADLLTTLEDLADGDAVDPVLREQVRREARWLREVVSSGLPDSGPLGVALRALAAERSAGGLAVELTLPAPEPVLDATVATALAEATREALTNVAKHAGTGRATVRVAQSQRQVLVEISDAGRGYDPGVTVARIGQTYSIRQRLAEVGGTVEIVTAPGAGTRVRLTAPAARP